MKNLQEERELGLMDAATAVVRERKYELNRCIPEEDPESEEVEVNDDS